MRTIQADFRFLRATEARWAELNPILDPGEPGYEEDTGKHKLGDGVSHWLDLEYFLPEAAIRDAIQQAIAEAGVIVGGSDFAALTAHINSTTPHPAYDDGPSLALLYQNAKV